MVLISNTDCLNLRHVDQQQMSGIHKCGIDYLDKKEACFPMVTVKVGLQKASAYQQVLAGTHQYGPSQRHRSVPLPPVWIQHLCSTGIL